MTKTSRAAIAVACGVALGAASLLPMQSPAPARPSTSTAPSAEFVMWCPDESLINGGKFYAWQVRRC